MTYRHAMVYINTFNVYDKRTRGNGYTPLNLMCTYAHECHEDSSSGSVQPGSIHPVTGFVIFLTMASTNISLTVAVMNIYAILHLDQ